MASRKRVTCRSLSVEKKEPQTIRSATWANATCDKGTLHKVLESALSLTPAFVQQQAEDAKKGQAALIALATLDAGIKAWQ